MTIPRHRLGGYTEYAPPPVLADCAEALWLHRTPLSFDDAGSAHRVLPDPSLSLAFACHRDDDGRPHDARILVIGPVETVRFFALVPGHELAAIRLRLEWAAPLLDASPGDHTDALNDAAGIARVRTDHLLEALYATRSARSALHILADAVAERRRTLPHRPDPLAARALDHVRACHGRIDSMHMARALDTSQRHLRRRVRTATGTTLRTFAAIRRFLHVVESCDTLARPAWARLAVEHGFFDQSHLARDYRRLAGIPPERLHRERRVEAAFS